jgi:CheY-like chemotaxis protein
MPNAAALKVLVVDDQTSVRQMTRLVLEKLGIRMIHEAENGQVALAMAMSQPLDLIISDYNMPEMDGVGLLRAVRGQAAVHFGHGPRRPRARRQSGASWRQQLHRQTVRRGHLAPETGIGDRANPLIAAVRSRSPRAAAW